MLRAGRLRFAGLGDEDDESTEGCELVHRDWSGFRVGGGRTVADADLADVRPGKAKRKNRPEGRPVRRRENGEKF